MSGVEHIEVMTGARLHFGLICGTEESGWKFGGVGLMVRDPGWRIRLANSSEPDQISGGSQCVAQRIATTIGQCQTLFSGTPASLTVEIVSQTPLHSGYGAGTQLALALGTAVHTLVKRKLPEDLSRLSQLLGRAGRSAIGTAGFHRGGFLVDRGIAAGGRESDSGTGTNIGRVQRLSIPDDWRFVLIRPIQSTGLSGAEERAFFDRRQTMSPEVVRKLVTLVEDELVPAVSGSDFPKFAAGLAAYGQTAGNFYAAQQGDVFAHPLMRAVADLLTTNGFPGAAQSSWGPGICIPAANTETAHRIQSLVQSNSQSAELTIQITEPLNCGATIRSRAPEPDESRRLA